MVLYEALEYARKGCFVTCNGLENYESIHWYNGKYYFEDGAVVTKEFLENSFWAAKGNWRIKASEEDVDKEKLKKMHEESKGLMLFTGSYEDCILTK